MGQTPSERLYGVHASVAEAVSATAAIAVPDMASAAMVAMAAAPAKIRLLFSFFLILSPILSVFRCAPPGVEYRWGLGRVREGKDLGAPVGPCGGSWGTVRRTGPGSGSSDHSSEPSVSAGAFASRRRDAISRAAPPPSTTTADNAISAMPAPVWARLLR